MPAYITPIERTRTFSVKPAGGLRYGNFEGVVHLPPVLKTTKLGAHSFSTFNNQQIYKTVCEWYEGWRPWQQRVLLCGIVDRCSIRQVDILATTLEPVRHRDYTVAAQHAYPTTPLKKNRPENTKKQKKRKAKKKLAQKLADRQDPQPLSAREALPGAETPVSVIHTHPGILNAEAEREINEKLNAPVVRRHNENVREFSMAPPQYTNMDEYADNLANKIINESIPKTLSLFDPSELYAQDLASSIMQQAMDNVVSNMDDKEKSLKKTPRLDKNETKLNKENTKVREEKKSKMKVEKKDAVEPKQDTRDPEGERTRGIDINIDKPDLALLDKYKRYKPPKKDKKGEDERPKSLVRIVIPDKTEDQENGDERSSPHSGVSKSLSMVTRSSLGKMRYKLFGARSLDTPDYFRGTGVGKLEGGMLHLRQGTVSRPFGMGQVPVSVGKMYKSIKWWTESPRDNKALVKAQKIELTTNFKDQLDQIWKWMLLWEDFEKIALLKELLKLCEPEDLNFLCSYLQQKLQNTKDFNRLPDKLLLYIFSYVPAEEMRKVSRVCRRWRYLCAMDDLWMIKCHELGLKEGVSNLEHMITKAKGYRMVVDWRMAYEELRKIYEIIKMGMKKKKPKQVSKGRTVEFKEELEKLKKRDTDERPPVGPLSFETNICKTEDTQATPPVGEDPRWDSSYSDYSTDSVESEHPRFEFRNKIKPEKEAPRGSLTRDELHSMLKRMLFEPEEAQQKQDRKGTPVIVELEVLRGTLSAIERQKKEPEEDGKSVVSEDLARFDDEYKLQWDTKPESKFPELPRESTVSLEGGVEVMEPSEDRFDRVKRLTAGLTPTAGPPILRRRREVKQMADDATGEDAAYDVRPDLHCAPDILGKTRPHMSLQWYETTKKSKGDGDDSDDESSIRSSRRHRFVGEVKSILRARKLQGHMSGITCVQYDRRRLVSAGLDRVIRMWDIRSGRSLHKFYGHKGGIRCLCYYGNELATGSWDTTIMIWDLRELERKLILTDHTDSVTCLAMSQDYMVSGSEDCTVRVWRRSSYLCCNVLRGHKSIITSIAFDGINVVSASKDMTLRLTNITTGECLHVMTDCAEPIVSVTMKGSLILSGDAQGRVHFWNKLNGECEAAIQAHSEAVTKIVYTEGRFYTAAADWSIKEWDLVTMTSVRLLQGHKGPIRDLKVTSDRIVSCSDDGSIRIWDLFDPRKKATMDEQIQQLHQQ